jgi:predicted RecA/RadA family phage recombinase
MPDAMYVRNFEEERVLLESSSSVGEVRQLADGRAAVFVAKVGTTSAAGSAGDYGDFKTAGEYDFPLASSVKLLAGARAWWDHSANNVTYRRNNDRDFYLGRVSSDSASNTVRVEINVDARYDWELGRDPHDTVITGTQGLNTMGVFQRGGAYKFILSATNEAQKMDILGKDGFALGANAIIEFDVDVVDDGAGTVVDVSVGVANATHATDADLITDSLFMHLNANDVNIYFESDEVTATDSTIDYTAGTRFHVVMDMRNPADVDIYVNGAQVLAATTFNVNASVATWFPLIHVEKTSSTDAYEIDIDGFRVRYGEQ